MFAGLQKNPLFRSARLREYAGLFRQIGMLLQGEKALYVRPGGARIPNVPIKIPEVTFVAAPGGGVDGAAVIDRLIARYAANSLVAPERTSIAGSPARKLDFGQGAVAGYYANVDGRLVVSDLPAGIRGVASGGD
jgi:hypothetical protein